MFTKLEQVKIISSFHQKTKPYGKHQNRLNHGFIFKVKGMTKYVFDNQTITIKEGEFIYIPKNASYEYFNLDDCNNLYTSINFEADIPLGKPTVYSFEDFSNKNFLVNHFSKTWKFASPAERLNCLSVFYNFLSHVIRLDSLKSKKVDKYFIIQPAVEYLKNRIYDKNLKIDKLHCLCGISSTYFRIIFKEIFNVNPQEYVLSNRLMHAKLIIENGDYNNIYEVAESVGFSDPLYFSKAYKKYFGFSPSKTIDFV